MPMHFIQSNWLLILVMVLSGAMLIWPLLQRRLAPGKEIGTLQATQLINRENAVLLDLRETAEYEGGHLPNALHIPLSQLESRGQELAKHSTRPVIAYCASGNRSRSAGKSLERLGLKDVYHLHGGFRAWKEAGLPTSR